MKIHPLLLLLAGFLFLTAGDSLIRAQTAATTDSDTIPIGSTVITSDELRMDQESRTAVFSGNVVVQGSNFKLTCQEMTVIFDKGSKVDTITAKGDVIIVQPGRITHSGEAQYFHEDDKFVLTDQPSILDNRNQIQAPKITIYRTKQSLYTEGRTTTTIAPGNGVGSGSPVPPDSNAK